MFKGYEDDEFPTLRELKEEEFEHDAEVEKQLELENKLKDRRKS